LKFTRSDFWKLTGIVLLLGATLLLAAYDQFLRDATTGFSEEIAFHVYPESTIEQVADSLVTLQILSKRQGFLWLAKGTGWGDTIRAGHYVAKTGASNRDLLEMLRRGLQTPIHMVVPGGTRKERLIRGMAREMAFSQEELAAAFKDEALASELNTDTTHLISSTGFPNPKRSFGV